MSSSAKTAKIVRFHETGPAEVLQFEELPIPEPGSGEVRLKVKAIGLNRAEILFRNGRYIESPVFPAKNGYEASGIVEAVGDGVNSSWVGKTVSTIPGTFSMNRYGVYGEVALVPAYSIAEYPSSLSFEEGASIWMQYLTAYGPLKWLGKITKDDFVVITAASSSVGIAAIELTKAEGAKSIAITRKAAKKSHLLQAGADHVVVTDEEDLITRVNEITSGKGVRLSLDPVGGKQLESIAKATSRNGMIFVYGGLAPEPTPFPLFATVGKTLTIRGYSLPLLVAHPSELETAKQYVIEHITSGAFKPLIAKTFPFSELVEAHRYMESNEQIGKIVVTV